MKSSTKSASKTVMIEELRNAYKLKGDTLSATDADQRLYGLRYKSSYTHRFGSWNKAQRAAGLPIHHWKGGRVKGTPNSADDGAQPEVQPSEQVELSAFEEYLAEKLRREREEVMVLERMMAELHHVRKIAV